VIIQIGFISCLVSPSISSGGDWYVGTRVFDLIEGWNVVAPAFSLIGKDAAIVGKVIKRGIIVKVVRSEVIVRSEVVGRGAIVDYWFCWTVSWKYLFFSRVI
jgi:hypothetical protein